MDYPILNRLKTLVPAFIFLLAFGFSLLGLNPTFYLDDSPETITACITMGVSHPPGYPLHSLMGHLLTLPPVGDFPFRANLFSVILAAVACVLLFFVLRDSLKVSAPLSFIFSLIWITGATVYPASLSAKTGIYLLTVVFLLAVLWALLDGCLGLAVFLFGLSLANHWMSMVVFLPGLLLSACLQWRGKTPKTNSPLDPPFFKVGNVESSLMPPIEKGGGGGDLSSSRVLKDPEGWERSRLLILPAILVLGLSLYLYLPLRAHLNPALNWGNPSTWNNFVFSFLRKEYSGPEAAGGPAVWFSQGWVYLKTAFFEFDGLLLLALFGMARMWSRSRATALGLGLSWLSLVLAVCVYLNLPKEEFYLIEDYTLSSHVFILLFAAWGLESLLAEKPEGKRGLVLSLLAAGLVLVFAWTGFDRYSEKRQTDYTYDYDYVLNGLKVLPRNALYFCKGDTVVFPCWYFQWVEGKRPDVAVVGVDGFPMDWIRKNLADSHTGLKVPFANVPMGLESIPPLTQWMVSHNRERELYFSYNKTEDGILPGTKTVLYGMVGKAFAPGTEVTLDDARADFCWNEMRLRHTQDNRFPMDERTAGNIVRDYGVFRNTLGVFYEDRADDEKARMGTKPKPEEFLKVVDDYQKSYNQFLWAAKWWPVDPQFAYNTGNGLFHLGRPLDSTVWYEKAIKLDPKYAAAYFNWAVAALQLTQYQKAGDLLEKALELKPDYAEAKTGMDYLVRNKLYKEQ